MRLDEARRELRRKVLIVGLLFGFTALIYLIFQVSQFSNLADVNAMDYAQIARHLMRGDGLASSFIKPLSLVYEPSIENHPELTYQPLHIVVISAMMRVLGANDRAVSHASGLAFLLSIPVVFTLGVRLFDWRTAVLATVLYGTHVTNLGHAISGLEASLLTLLVTGLLLLLYCAAGSESRELLWVAAAGVVMGLLYLTKDVWSVAAVPAAIYLAYVRPEKRLQRVGLFLAITVVVMAPWLYRNYALTGRPFFSLRWHEMLGQTKAYPMNTIYRLHREDIPSYLVFAADNPRAVIEKVRGGLTALYAAFPSLAGIFVTPFFITAVLVRLGDQRTERLRYLMYGLLVLVSLALTFFSAAPRLVAPLGGFATVLAAAFFWRLLDARTQPFEPWLRARWTWVAVAVLLVLHLHPFVMSVTPEEPRESGDDPLEQAMTQLAEAVDGPVLTDIPWSVAWIGDLDAVWIPQTEADLKRMEQRVGRFNWLLLSPTVARMATAERLDEWAAAWVNAEQGDAEIFGFRMAARLGDGRWVLMRREEIAGVNSDGQ
ncbi:MAG TPA: hypothetical protein DEP45_08335 [Armatimonadetes bacterium]|nr:hypothetical protein [Armatimonadota bacterium]